MTRKETIKEIEETLNEIGDHFVKNFNRLHSLLENLKTETKKRRH